MPLATAQIYSIILWKFLLIMDTGYSAIPTLKPATCNEKKCIQQQHQLIAVNYYFPSWLLRRALLLQYRWAPTDGGTISVKTPRAVSMHAPIFFFSEEGKIAEIQRLFTQGLASPFDIDEQTGQSCLQVSCSALSFLARLC